MRARSAAALLVLAAAVLAVAAKPALGDPTIASKQAEVHQVLGEINQLDLNLERAVEAYNAATTKLNGIESDLQTNLHELHVARANLQRSRHVLDARLITLYTTGDENSTLGILLGAGSISDLLGRAEAADRVSGQDIQIQHQVIAFKAAVRTHRVRLKQARTEQRQVVQQRANEKASIGSQLAERKRLVASIRQEIQHMKAAEAARQAALAQQARARALAATAPAIVSSPTTTTTTSTPTPVAPPPGNYGGVVAIAMQYLGVPYVWGGASPSGFDCSGFTMYVFAQVGISLPHNAAAQFSYGTPVSINQLEPGDLVFFYGLGHVGIYIGGGEFIHSPHTGDVVKISPLAGYYASNFDGGRRL